jgi:putative hydrolase of HD superfamily
MVTRQLIETIFHAAYMERWNDKIRPMPLIEMDKQAHKMVLSYILGKFEAEKQAIRWERIIEGGIFEFLQRLVLTDIKPAIFYKIKGDSEKYKKLNEFVFQQLEPSISSLGSDFCNRFQSHFSATNDTIEKRILSAAHFYSSQWEFSIVERSNPNGYDINDIRKDFHEKVEQYLDLNGMRNLILHDKYRRFSDLCGTLRFQSRWANISRIPKTSVLGHSLFVAIFSYFFSLQLKACTKRLYNNFFCGLFHDLPEVLTRDIVSPIKAAVEGLRDMIKESEHELMSEIVYPLLPTMMIDDIQQFTEDEFETTIRLDNKRLKATTEEINQKYNENSYAPQDGQLIKAADELSAFMEAYTAIENGSTSPEFGKAVSKLQKKYTSIGNLFGIDFASIYLEFGS